MHAGLCKLVDFAMVFALCEHAICCKACSAGPSQLPQLLFAAAMMLGNQTDCAVLGLASSPSLCSANFAHDVLFDSMQ